MRTLATKQKSIHQYNGFGNQLWDLAGARPSLDLQFADRKDLNDAVTGSNLIEFSRASSGTYIDSDGLIKKARTNFLEDSEGFGGSTFWGKNNVRGTITDNAPGTLAPNNTLTASLYIENTETGGRSINNGETFKKDRVYTISCWAKQYTTNRYFGLIFPASAFGVNQVVAFNITGDGSFTISNGTGTASIEAYPNGWYRCSLTATATNNANGFPQLRMTDSTTVANQAWTGDGVSGIYIWGAQLEESSAVSGLIKTTGTVNSAPRFEHDPITGESLGLLMEQQSTNNISNSSFEFFNTNTLTKESSTETNPEGVDSCFKITADAGSGGHRVLSNAVTSEDITVSAFVKKDTYRYVNLGFGGLSNSFSAVFDIEPGITTDRLLGQGIIGNNSTNIAAGYQNLPNDWVRIWASGTTTGTNGFSLAIHGDETVFTILNWIAEGTESIFIHGAQFETGIQFPTSYIPTQAGAGTRDEDHAIINNTNLINWYNQSEGTIFNHTKLFRINEVGGTTHYKFSSGTSANRIEMFGRANSSTGLRIFALGTQELNSNVTNQNVTEVKVACAFKPNDFQSESSDGRKEDADNFTLPNTISQLELGNSEFGTSPLNGILSRITYWPSRLPGNSLTKLAKQ